MTPAQLYAMPSERIEHDLHLLASSNFNFLPEVSGDVWDWNNLTSTEIDIRIIKEHSFDGRRIWRLATVWFGGAPVMVIQNAGREGDDFTRKFVTDVGAYSRLVIHLRGLMRSGPEHLGCIYNPTADIPNLTDFYNHDLLSRFDVWDAPDPE